MNNWGNLKLDWYQSLGNGKAELSGKGMGPALWANSMWYQFKQFLGTWHFLGICINCVYCLHISKINLFFHIYDYFSILSKVFFRLKIFSFWIKVFLRRAWLLKYQWIYPLVRKRQTTYRSKENSSFFSSFLCLSCPILDWQRGEAGPSGGQERQSETFGQTNLPVWALGPLLLKGHFFSRYMLLPNTVATFFQCILPRGMNSSPLFDAANFPSGANCLFTRHGIRDKKKNPTSWGHGPWA